MYKGFQLLILFLTIEELITTKNCHNVIKSENYQI